MPTPTPPISAEPGRNAKQERLMPLPPTGYAPYDFANRRHIGPSPEEMADMLRAVGAPTLDALIDETVPADIRHETLPDFGPALSESEMLARLRAVAAKNRVMTSLIGMGYHDTVLPPAIQRNVLENPAWYTAY